MKKLLFILVISSIAATVSAQKMTGSSKSAIISIGLDAGIPVGTEASALSSFFIGGSLEGDFKVAPELGLTVSAGYQSWTIKKNTIYRIVFGKSIDFVPVLGGIKYYFTPKVYGSGQLGVSFQTKNGGGSSFTYAPGIGFKISNNVDILAKYTGIASTSVGNLNSIGVRLAYSF